MARRLSVLTLMAVASFGLMPGTGNACSYVVGAGAQVEVVDESAIIVWDGRTHTEHFIRRAEFQSSAKDFGFLVPTPSPPTLTAASDNAFEMLEETYPQRYISRPMHGLKLTSWLFMPQMQSQSTSAGSTTAAAPPPAVEVLSAQHVAGYQAVVLKADDAAALTAWLRTHGYAARPAFADWLKPYVQRHWAITAFKIAKAIPRSPQVGSSAVRMSFSTPAPFFPYSEPADQRGAGRYAVSRLLRLFVLSSARMDGQLDSATTRWPGYARWAITLYAPTETTRQATSELTNTLGLKQAQMPTPLWLSALEDRSSPRPGITDLYFQPSAQQTPLVPPPVEEVEDKRIGIPIELVLLVLALLIARIAGVRRRANIGRT